MCSEVADCCWLENKTYQCQNSQNFFLKIHKIFATLGLKILEIIMTKIVFEAVIVKN